ncbi:MAG: hypothetical protein WCG28_01850 [bacterium]
MPSENLNNVLAEVVLEKKQKADKKIEELKSKRSQILKDLRGLIQTLENINLEEDGDAPLAKGGKDEIRNRVLKTMLELEKKYNTSKKLIKEMGAELSTTRAKSESLKNILSKKSENN